MLIILAVVGLTLGATAIQIVPELAGEAIAMYIVEPPEDTGYGASLEDPEKTQIQQQDSTQEYKTATYPSPTYGTIMPVLLSAVTEQETPGNLNAAVITGALDTESPPKETDSTSGRVQNPSGLNSTPAKPTGLAESEEGENDGALVSAMSTKIAETSEDGDMKAGDSSPSTPTDDYLLLGLMREKPKMNPDGTIFLPIATQRAFSIRTVIGEITSAPIGIELPGRVVVNPSSSILVQASYPGVLEKVGGRFPYVGQEVSRGELLAKLRPINNHLAEAQIREKITELSNHVELAKKRMAMLEEVVYIRYRVNKIEEIRTEIQGLIRRVSVLEDSLTKSYDLRAQTDGVISEIGVMAGQHVEDGTTLFRIIDPTMLWVEASGYQPGLQKSIQGATALTLEGESISLKFVGGGLALSNQAIPLLFEVVGTEITDLAIDNPVTVFVQTEENSVRGIKVPRSSIARSTDGAALLWSKISSEEFLQHRVSVTPIDAEHVLVVGEIALNPRIVSEGVGLLAQIR